MSALPAVLGGLAVAVLLMPAPTRKLVDIGVRPASLARPRAARPARPARVGPTGACVLGGVAVALVVGPPAGLVLGAVAALVGPRLLARLEPRSARQEREQLLLDLPLTLDLLAACLSAGAPLAAVAEVVAAALPGPCAARLRAVAAALRVGAPPEEAWQHLSGGRPDDPLAPAARALARSARSGAPVAAAVARHAAEARAAARSQRQEAARRAGVAAVGPLGLCFLPAFVLIGVVPVVVGLAAPLLSTL